MARIFYEVWKVSSDYVSNLQELKFIEVNVKKELMKIPTFYFTIRRDANSELTAPAVGDKIKIFRNYGEILRGTILKMEVRDDTFYYEGVSSADDWNYYNSNYLEWNNVNASVILNQLATDVGWTLGTVDDVLISKFIYDYGAYYEQIDRLAKWVRREYLFDEINKKLYFQAQVGTDKSATIRFIRGVNLEEITVKKEQDETWTKVICLGAGDGKKQLKSVRGTGNKVKVFVDKSIQKQADLDKFADEKLAEGNQPLYVYYEAKIDSPLFNFDIGDTVWLEDSLNKINQPMRIMEYSLTFNESETIDVTFANKRKTLTDFFRKLEAGQRTLSNVNHSSAVQKNAMIQVDEDNDPILLTVNNSQLVNSTTGNTIGAIENNVTTAQSTANSAQTSATNAQTTASTALTQANTALNTANSKEPQVSKGTTAPPSPQLNQFWLDTSVIPNVWRRWDGTSWVDATPVVAINLLHNSQFLDTSYWGFDSGWSLDTNTKFEGMNTMKCDISGQTSDVYWKLYSEDIQAKEGDVFTASIYLMTDDVANLSWTCLGIRAKGKDGSIINFAQQGASLVNGQWSRISLTFTCPAGTETVQLYTRPNRNGRYWAAKPMLQRGDKLGTWTPHLDETVSTIKATVIKGGVLTLGGYNNINGKFYLYNASGDTVAEFDGANNLVTLDTLQVGQIYSGSVPSYSNQDKTIYVDFVAGNDEYLSSEVSNSKPYRSIARALQDVPRVNDGTINIYIKTSGTEVIFMSGISGGGTINFYFQGYTLNGQVIIHSTTNSIYFYNTIFNFQGDSTYGVVQAFKSPYVALVDCKIYGRGLAQSGLVANDFSQVQYVSTNSSTPFSSVEGCVTDSIIARYGSNITVTDVVGGGATWGLSALYGGVIGGSGKAPSGTQSPYYRALNGGSVWSGFTYTSSSSTPPSAPDTIKTWNSVSGDSYRSTVYVGWRGDGTVRQGQWDGYGLHHGCWFFGTTPSSTVTGKTIKRMRVYLSRLTTGGNGGAVTVYIRNHSHASKPAGQPDVSSYAAVSASFSAGQSKWVDLPSSFFTAWQNGTAKGVGIYTSSTSNNYYAIFSASAKLEITYA